MNTEKLAQQIVELKNLPDASYEIPDKDSILEFENTCGFKLPQDLRYFYSQLEELTILDEAYSFIKLDTVKQAGLAIFDDKDMLPASWFAFCFLGESWLGFDSSRKQAPIIDLDPYETEFNVIAFSLENFFCKLAESNEKSLFWLTNPGLCEGKAVVYESSTSLRKTHKQFWDNLEVDTTGLCAKDGCSNSKVVRSVHCRSHHFESIVGSKCPFETSIEWGTTYRYTKNTVSKMEPQ